MAIALIAPAALVSPVALIAAVAIIALVALLAPVAMIASVNSILFDHHFLKLGVDFLIALNIYCVGCCFQGKRTIEGFGRSFCVI